MHCTLCTMHCTLYTLSLHNLQPRANPHETAPHNILTEHKWSHYTHHYTAHCASYTALHRTVLCCTVHSTHFKTNRKGVCCTIVLPSAHYTAHSNLVCSTVGWKVHPHTPIGCRKGILLRKFVGKLLTNHA